MASMLAIKNLPLLREAVRRARGCEQAHTAEKRARKGVTDPMEEGAWGPVSPYDQ